MAAAQTVEPARSSRGGRHRDPSRDGVIRAAILRLLAEVGYGALTMDAVAAEAGVGKATIYRRWRTKQDLVVDTIADLNRVDAMPPDTGSLEDDLRLMLRSPSHPRLYGEENTMPAFRDWRGLTGAQEKDEYVALLKGAKLDTKDVKFADLADVDREILIRYLTADYRVVFGGQPITAPDKK